MSSTISRIGKYELRQVLARTPASTVHDGWDCDLERRVAIKTVAISGSDHPPRPLSSEGDGSHSDSIRPATLRLGAATISDDSASSATDEALDSLTRFRRGARAAGKLVHPNIAGVYDYGETHDRAYIVMEFIDGPTLKELFERNQRFDTNQIISMLSSILEALQYSHDHGVVHRDIKPANVMFTSDMRVKLTDFGIARLEDSDVTQTGTIMGTPAYMSPEQFLGERVDQRSDLYSTGVILYQMLTGERPYEGTGLATVMHKVLYTSPPPPSQVSSVNSNFDVVVACAMAKKREQRFARATAFIAALQAAGSNDPEALAKVMGNTPHGPERGLQVRPGASRLGASRLGGGASNRPGSRSGAGARAQADARQAGRGGAEIEPSGSRKLVLIASGIAGLALAGGAAAWLMHGAAPSRDVASVNRATEGSATQGSVAGAGPGRTGQTPATPGSAPGGASRTSQDQVGQDRTGQGQVGQGQAGQGSGAQAPGSRDQGPTGQDGRALDTTPGQPATQRAPQVTPPLATPFPTLPPPAATGTGPTPAPPVADETAPPLFGSPGPARNSTSADTGRPYGGDPALDPLPVPPIPDTPPATPSTPVPSFSQDASRTPTRRPPATAEHRNEPERRAAEPPATRYTQRDDRSAPSAPQRGTETDSGSTLPPWLRRDQNALGSRADLAPGARPTMPPGAQPDPFTGARPDMSAGTRPDTSAGIRPDTSAGARPDNTQGPGGGSAKPPAEPPVAGADIPYTSMSGTVGLMCQSLTTESAQTFGLDSPQGMIVIGVTSGGAASQAGIRVKDVILRINGEPTRNLSGIGKLGAQVVPVELLRQGKRQVVQLQIAGL